jgi:signal peptidase I
LWRVLLVAVLALVALKLFVIDVYTVPQQGMLPGVAPGSRFLGWKRPYLGPSQVKRGDVVVFTRRLDDGKGYQFVWRVVGLPGDRLDRRRYRAGERAGLAREPVRNDGPLAIYGECNGGVTYEVAYPAHAAGPPPLPYTSFPTSN